MRESMCITTFSIELPTVGGAQGAPVGDIVRRIGCLQDIANYQ